MPGVKFVNDIRYVPPTLASRWCTLQVNPWAAATWPSRRRRGRRDRRARRRAEHAVKSDGVCCHDVAAFWGRLARAIRGATRARGEVAVRAVPRPGRRRPPHRIAATQSINQVRLGARAEARRRRRQRRRVDHPGRRRTDQRARPLNRAPPATSSRRARSMPRLIDERADPLRLDRSRPRGPPRHPRAEAAFHGRERAGPDPEVHDRRPTIDLAGDDRRSTSNPKPPKTAKRTNAK